jgi:penicillin V acylase-like amidase (Ntn superfamily)
MCATWGSEYGLRIMGRTSVRNTFVAFRRIGIAVILLALFHAAATGCTVFYVYDGKLALAGDNEDWHHPHSQVWFVPATKDNHGIVYFGLGLGEYPDGGIYLPKVKIPEGGVTKIDSTALYGFPQGGMNDQGLFFGGAGTDLLNPKMPAPGKKMPEGFIADLILRKCATVEDVVKFLEPYDVGLPQGQLLFGDKAGDSLILETGNVIIRKKGNHQVITNFRQSQVKPERIDCSRFKMVTKTLAEKPPATVDLCRTLCKKAGTSGTLYSTVFDMTHGEVYIYNRYDFNRVVKLNLQEELRKGPRAVTLASLFAK